MKRSGSLSTAALLALACAAALPAHGEIVDSAPGGFTVKNAVTVAAPAAVAYRALVGGIDRWWSPVHTFSGESRNLWIEDRANGCFCEKLQGRGSVRHLTVVYADPGKMLRLTGGLGPLQGMAVTGSMTWRLAESGKATVIETEYAVGGYHPGGLEELAAPVDGVLRDQMERLKSYIETGKPESSHGKK